MCDVEWSVSSHRQTHGSSNCCGARCDGFPNRRRPPVGSHGLDLAATSSYPRDTTVTVPPQQATFQASNTASLRLSTEGLVLRKSLASANAFRCFFAEGKIGDSMHGEPHFHTSCTSISFAKPFILNMEIEKEGLPRDSPAALGAGGSRFKSVRPANHFFVFPQL